MKKNIADLILARKYADGGEVVDATVEAPKLDLVQEALDASHAVQQNQPLPPSPATTEAALGMATNVLGMEGDVPKPAEAPINMSVVDEIMGTGPKPMYQPTAERSVAAPNVEALPTQKLSREVDFAARRKAQMPVGGKRPKFAQGGIALPEDKSDEAPYDPQTHAGMSVRPSLGQDTLDAAVGPAPATEKNWTPDQPEQGLQETGLLDPTQYAAAEAGGSLARRGIGAAEKALAPKASNLLELEHYSNMPNLTTIDPARMGTGYDARSANRAFETPVSFHYVKGAAPETESGLHAAPYKYSSAIDPDKAPIYDLSVDPQGIAAKSIEENNGVVNMSEIAKSTKDAGYAGFKVSQHPHEPSRNAIMLFEPTQARKAMTTETRGQNSWVNFGPHGEANRANPAKTVYADQKAGLLPDWAVNEGAPTISPAKLRQKYAEGGEVEAAPDSVPEPAPPQVADTQEAPQANAGGINVINPEGSLVSIPQATLQDALGMGYSIAPPEQVKAAAQQQQYGGGGQQFKAGLEGIAQGVVGPLAPLAERAFGARSADIRGREEANPWTHGVGEFAGLVGGTMAGVGIGAGVEGAGAAARAAMPLGKATFVGQLIPEAVKGAFEMGLLQGGEELSKLAKEDPNQTAETALTDIGLAAAMGGLFGSVLGAAVQKAKFSSMDLPEMAEPAFVSQLDHAALEAGDLSKSIEHQPGIPEGQKEGLLEGILRRKYRADATAFTKMAEENGWPVLEGMTTDDQAVHRAEDYLRNSPLTRAGARRGAMWQDAWEKGVQVPAEEAIPQSRYTKAEVGDILKQTISAQLEEQNAPIKAMYDEIKQYHDVIPLSERSAPAIARNIAKIQELRISPSSPEGALAKRVMREIGNLKTVDDVKLYKSVLMRSLSPTASSGEKRMASILADKLTDLEESSIERFAKTQMKTPRAKAKILDLIEQRKTANASYKEMINKVKTLSEQLGKGRVYGIQDALNFIKERLSPEEITQKLNSLKDSEFRKFFAKEYPEGHELLKEYQKGVMHDAAFLGERVNPLKFHKALDKLEPEIQKSLFTPQQLQKIEQSRAYMARFPKNFNPSGTAQTLKFGESFSPYATAAMALASGHPAGAIAALSAKPLGELRDLAMEQFIKGAKNSPEVIKATMLAQATVKGDKLSSRAVNAIFKGGAMPFTAAAVLASREKLAHLVETYAAQPDKLFNSGDGNPLPQYAQAFAGANARAVQYLAAQRPNTDPTAPLDTRREATVFEKAKYNNALDMAQQPLLILDKIQKGMLTPQDLQTVQTIYPNLYKTLQQKVMGQITDMKSKGKTLPYAQRLQLSTFLGTPLDSTLTPQGILGLQRIQAGSGQHQQGQSGSGSLAKPSQAGATKLQGLSKAAMTPSQARSAERSAGK